jgi:hypothetical protein
VSAGLKTCLRQAGQNLHDEKNLWGLDISKFGGLRSAQHADVDAGKFSDQFVGISASQCRGVDLSGQ